MRSLYITTAVVTLLVAVSLTWVNNDADAPLAILFLSFGALGAVVRENVDYRARSETGKPPAPAAIVCFSPVVGALLALILVSLFLSGFVTGDFFPNFVNTEQPFESGRSVLRGGITLASNEDFYKLIAWSTIAGYSQRLVLARLEGIGAPAGENAAAGK